VTTAPANIPPPTNPPRTANPEVIPAALNPNVEPLTAIAAIGTPTPASLEVLSSATRLNIYEWVG